MRRWTWSVEVGVLVVAILIATRSAVAAAPNASLTPIEPASSRSLFDRLTSPLASAHSSKNVPIQTVALPPRTAITFPKKSGFRPAAPNIHTHPPKKSKLWYPFRKK